MSHNDSSKSQQGPGDPEAWSPSQLSQALRDLARGEQTANALENNLSKLESKLDELLASFEDIAREVEAKKDPAASAKDDNEKDSEQKSH